MGCRSGGGRPRGRGRRAGRRRPRQSVPPPGPMARRGPAGDRPSCRALTGRNPVPDAAVPKPRAGVVRAGAWNPPHGCAGGGPAAGGTEVAHPRSTPARSTWALAGTILAGCTPCPFWRCC
ncbi:hypothetical protein QJS66_00370 [Kocuria rhizophila]|nr:hypothetical protein QJS66_00370 [Kocuria rhizophila]